MKNRTSVGILLALLLTLLTLLAGCGKSKETVKHKEVTIAYIAAPIAFSSQILMNIDNKVIDDSLAKDGIKVKWVVTRSLDNIYPMMDKDEVDFVYLPGHATTTYVTETSKFGGSDKFRIIAGSLAHNQYILMGGKSVKELKDLAGKKVGIVNHNYNEEMVLNKKLEQVGLKTKSQGGTVDIEYQDVFSDLMKGFTDGKYDAVANWTSNRAEIEKNVPGSTFLINTAQGIYDKPITNVFLIANKDFIKNDPELVRDILRAHIKATDLALTNKDKLPQLASEQYYKYFTEKVKAVGFVNNPQSYYTQDWSTAVPIYDPNTAYVKDIYDFDVKGGYIKRKTLANFMDLKLLNEVLHEQGKAQIK